MTPNSWIEENTDVHWDGDNIQLICYIHGDIYRKKMN